MSADLPTLVIGALIGLTSYFLKSSISRVEDKFKDIESELKDSYLVQSDIKSIEKEVAILSRNLETAFKKIDQLNEKLNAR